MFVGATVGHPPAGGPAGPGPGSLLVGEPLRRRGIVEDVRETTGRSGELVFVKVGYEVKSGAATVSEVQDLVYRPAPPSPGPATPGPRPAPVPLGAGGDGPDDPGWSLRLDLTIEPTLLFRFSALTYNAHRIHYDRRWATEQEGYPGLVVHGPLQAIALAELCRRRGRGHTVRSFRFRAVNPAFDDGPLLLRGRIEPEGDRATLVAFDHRGTQTMTAEAGLG
jgi:3-methylfumaryl-CoA hydratase